MSKIAENRKYNRQQHAKKDIQQYVFTHDNGKTDFKANPHKFATFTEKGIDPFKNVTCPFCLGLNKLRLSLISTKKGFDRGNGNCPLCGHRMKFQTLLKVMTSPEQYAVFAFTYPAWSFWERVKHAGFDTWKKRLGMMGWTERFWNEYKRLRGDPEKEEEEAELEAKWSEYNVDAEGEQRRYAEAVKA